MAPAAGAHPWADPESAVPAWAARAPVRRARAEAAPPGRERAEWARAESARAARYQSARAAPAPVAGPERAAGAWEARAVAVLAPSGLRPRRFRWQRARAPR